MSEANAARLAPASQDVPAVAAEKPTLPKLSAKEFKIYNHMAEHMDLFHNHFRQTWTTLHTAATTGRRPASTSLHQFLSLASSFCSQLTLHHSIEEQHIFPVLARKMPAFRQELELLEQHKRIHGGVDLLEAWVAACKSGEREVRMEELRVILDGFGKVLWEHLDAEVKALGAEEMKRAGWTVEEMGRMPM